MSAICKDCDRDMTLAIGCSIPLMILGGKEYKRIRYGDEKDKWGSAKCHDCGAQRGGYHHFGCDVERCPKCSLQLITCEC